MFKIIGDKEVHFNVKLGVTIAIKKEFNKPFNLLLKEMDKFDTVDFIRFLYCAVDQEKWSRSDFAELIYENLGLIELIEMVQLLIKKIQYPTLTEEEIDAKLEEKNA